MRVSIKNVLLSVACTLSVVLNVHAHEFSTSFITVKGGEEGSTIRWQLTFHDLAALNSDWIKGKNVTRSLLNKNLDAVERFINKSLIINAEDGRCHLSLTEQSPWSKISFAGEQYIVMSSSTECHSEQLLSLRVEKLWGEFPDHKVIVESDGLATSASQNVLSAEEKEIAFEAVMPQ